jgi:hypothetical protein
MKNSWESLCTIAQSIEQLLTDESSSIEIQASANHLQNSLLPCLDELKQSAKRLKALIQNCLKDLEQAEDIWLSKPRVAEAPQPPAWGLVGELTGYSIKFRRLGEQFKTETTAEFINFWEESITKLKNNFFWDEGKKNFKNSLNIFEKDNLLKKSRYELGSYANQLQTHLISKLQLVYEDVNVIQSDITKDYIECLDQEKKQEFLDKISTLSQEIQLKFDNPTALLPTDFVKDYKSTFLIPIETITQKTMFGVSLDQFNQFDQDVKDLTKKIINSVIDDRVNLAIDAIEETLSFYNYFLELQKRYQQETPEQRAAEKAWINQQRKQLKQVKKAVKAILNPEEPEEIEDGES